jgi:hypothetical protein
MRNGLIFAILVILLLAANGAEARVVDESRPIASDARVEFSAVTGKFEVRAVSGNQMRLTGRLGEGVEELVIDGERDAWYIEVKHKDNHRGRGGNTELLLEVPASVSLQASVVSGDFDVRGLEGAGEERVRVLRELVGPDLPLEVDGDYFLIHHTEADTVDKIDPDDMARAAAAVAVMTYIVADMPQRLR